MALLLCLLRLAVCILFCINRLLGLHRSLLAVPLEHGRFAVADIGRLAVAQRIEERRRRGAIRILCIGKELVEICNRCRSSLRLLGTGHFAALLQ